MQKKAAFKRNAKLKALAKASSATDADGVSHNRKKKAKTDAAAPAASPASASSSTAPLDSALTVTEPLTGNYALSSRLADAMLRAVAFLLAVVGINGLIVSPTRPLHASRLTARASSPQLLGSFSSASKPGAKKAAAKKAVKKPVPKKPVAKKPAAKNPFVTKKPATKVGAKKTAAKPRKPWQASEEDIVKRTALVKLLKTSATIAKEKQATEREARPAEGPKFPSFSFRAAAAEPPPAPPPPAPVPAASELFGQLPSFSFGAPPPPLPAPEPVAAAPAATDGGFELGEFFSMCAQLAVTKAQLAVQEQQQAAKQAALDAWEDTKAVPERAKQSLIRSASEAADAVVAAPGQALDAATAAVEDAAAAIKEAPDKIAAEVSGKVKAELDAAQEAANAQVAKAKRLAGR